MSALETQTQFEDQKRTIHELQHQLADAEHQLIEAEILRKKLHNTILVSTFLHHYLHWYICNRTLSYVLL